MDEAELEQRCIERFGANCRRIRDAKGISLRQLMMESGMNLQHYSKIERGKLNPTLWSIIRISRGLAAPVEELFEGTGLPKSWRPR